MNNNLNDIDSYALAKMNSLLASSTLNPAYSEIKLSIDEPKHVSPKFILDVLEENLDSLDHCLTTNTTFELRQTIAHWLERRFFLHHVNANTQVLPVMETHKAIFSFAQVVVHYSTDITTNKHSILSPPIVITPNPFYQIHEEADVLAQATPYFIPRLAENNFKENYRLVPKHIWEQTQLLFVCNPNNSMGTVMTMDDWELLIRLSDQYGFILASDEGYSELYFDEPPIGLLQACTNLGRDDFKNCVVFHSLFKRSNILMLRSGFIAGDASLLDLYLQYQNFAMPISHQLASIAAWQDERHVRQNRADYKEKFALWMEGLGTRLSIQVPEAGFYFWLKVPELFNGDDEQFVKALYEQVSIYALAGRYLSHEVEGCHLGKGYVRLSLVASVDDSQEAICRILKLLDTEQHLYFDRYK